MKVVRIYYCINCAINGYPCQMNESEELLAKDIKRMIVDVANQQVEKGKINSAQFATRIKDFYGHNLSWNKRTWRRSAEIVYNYYKAKKLIEKINEYKKMFGTGKEIVGADYLSVLHFFYNSISQNKEIDYSQAPIIISFELYPQQVLDEVLLSFKNNFE